MKPETRFKIRVLEKLKGIKGSVWYKIQQVSLRGTPDILGCVQGNFVAIELKVGDNKADSLQEYNIKRIKESRGIAFVMTPENEDECLALLNNLSLRESI